MAVMSRRQRRIKYVQDIDYGDGDDINDDDPGCVRNPRTGSDRPHTTHRRDVRTEQI